MLTYVVSDKPTLARSHAPLFASMSDMLAMPGPEPAREGFIHVIATAMSKAWHIFHDEGSPEVWSQSWISSPVVVCRITTMLSMCATAKPSTLERIALRLYRIFDSRRGKLFVK